MTGYADGVAAATERIGTWGDLPFFRGGFADVQARLSEQDGSLLPPSDEVFAALTAVHPEAVRVVILGQDPYPTKGHAHGLAFSVRRDVTPLPRSLGNIYRELEDDVGVTAAHGNLERWAAQGVLLLNTALTVAEGDAGSHAKIGWDSLTRQIVTRLAAQDKLVWILWGRHAQSYRRIVDAGAGKDTCIIESAHPSPLSARRGFFGSKPFSRTNDHLTSHGLAPIDWMP